MESYRKAKKITRKERRPEEENKYIIKETREDARKEDGKMEWIKKRKEKKDTKKEGWKNK